MSPSPDREDIARATRALGGQPVAWRAVTRGGQTAASRWIATLGNGSTAFVKIGYTLDTASWIRDEHQFYARHRGLDFMPELRGWDDDGERPVLVLEDLSDAEWPPPWDDAAIDAVVSCLDVVHAIEPPADLVAADRSGMAFKGGWAEIAREPAAFLRLRLCTQEWLESCWHQLHDAAQLAPIDGDALLHGDVRSDNLCLRAGRAMLIDWNWACVGDPAFDLAAWLPSLHAEGGPAPEALLADGASWAALLSGFFSAHAGRPPILEAPHVRPMQLMQARPALDWAARSLGLPPPSAS